MQKNKVIFEEISSIEEVDYNDDVYDIEVEDNHNYFANNHLVHNCHRMVLQGLFGPIKKFVSTKDLINSGSVATFKIKAVVLKHPQEIKDAFRKKIKTIQKEKRYHAEKEFIINSERRNLFIRNLVWSLKDQNNLILFELVEKHGKVLEPLLRKEGRHLHFIHGGTSGEERERIRHLVENDPVKNHDILASFGTFSTGSNLKRLDNLILASGSKSEIRILQSIGRTLRKGNGADDATLYDITDDLSHGSYTNYTLEHFKKRIEIYSSEQFPFRIINVDLN
jgi:superfamily II DNA or RNA helicase